MGKKEQQSNMRSYLAEAASTTASNPEKKAYKTKFDLLDYQFPGGAIGYNPRDLIVIYKRDLLQLALVTMTYHGYNKKLSDLTSLFPAKHVLKLSKKYKTELRSMSFEILAVKQARNLMFHEINFLKKKLKRTFELIEENDELDAILVESYKTDSMIELIADSVKDYLDWQPYSIETFTGTLQDEELNWEDVEAFDKLLGLKGEYVTHGEAGAPFVALGASIDSTPRHATRKPSATMKKEINDWFEKEFNDTLAETDDPQEAEDDYDTITQQDLEKHIHTVNNSKKRFIKNQSE